MVNTAIQEKEREFKPLLASGAALGFTGSERDRVSGNYYFMYEAPQGFAYKHIWTREYNYITEAGEIHSGLINCVNYPLPANSEYGNENNLEKGGLRDEI